MRKMRLITLALAVAAALTACSVSTAGTKAESGSAAGASASENVTEKSGGSNPVKKTVTVTSLNARKEATELEVPYDPQRIVTLDMAALDILDNLGLADRVVGSADTSLDYLQSYMEDKTVKKAGTIKEADLEAVMASEPDVIFIGGRLSASYDALSEIAPVVYLAVDTELGVVESVRKNTMEIASMFGLEERAEEKLAGFEERLEALKIASEGKTAVVGMCTSGSFNMLGNDGRCSLIGREAGFENVSDGEVTSTHGNESSFELLVQKNPDYIFVLDRDAAIASEGAKLAQDIMENELVMGTDAWNNGNVVYLEHPAVWYTAEGGITALDVMIGDLEGIMK